VSALGTQDGGQELGMRGKVVTMLGLGLGCWGEGEGERKWGECECIGDPRWG
jgi:hypothetical protein